MTDKEIIAALSPYEDGMLTAEVNRRQRERRAAITRERDLEFRRGTLAANVTSAQHDLDGVEVEHQRRVRNHASFIASLMNAPAYAVREAEIMVEQSTRAVAAGQARVAAAKAALADFDGVDR